MVLTLFSLCHCLGLGLKRTPDQLSARSLPTVTGDWTIFYDYYRIKWGNISTALVSMLTMVPYHHHISTLCYEYFFCFGLTPDLICPGLAMTQTWFVQVLVWLGLICPGLGLAQAWFVHLLVLLKTDLSWFWFNLDLICPGLRLTQAWFVQILI